MKKVDLDVEYTLVVELNWCVQLIRNHEMLVGSRRFVFGSAVVHMWVWGHWSVHRNAS